MRKKLCLTALVLVVLLGFGLAACGKKVNDYSASAGLWQNEPVSPQTFDAVCALTEGGVPVDKENSFGYGAAVTEAIEGETLKFKVSVPAAGEYNLGVDYYINHNGFNDSELLVEANGKEACARAPLFTNWTFESYDFAADSFGNDVSPTQIKLTRWQTARLNDFYGSNALALPLSLNAGENDISLTLVSGGSTYIGAVRVLSCEKLISYEDYKKTAVEQPQGAGTHIAEGEKPEHKSSLDMTPYFSSSVNATPYDTYKMKLNYMEYFGMGTDSLTYKLTVPKSGLYKLAFNYVTGSPNRTIYISVRVDGKVPFGELLHYPLEKKDDFFLHTLGNGEDFMFALTEGEHTVEIVSDGNIFAGEISLLKGASDRLNLIYLDLKKIAGASKDPNREWNPDTDYPGVVESLQEIRESIISSKDNLKRLNGTSANFQAVVYLEAVIKSLDGLLKKPQKIANDHAKLAEGSGSVVQTLANAYSDVEYMPLGLDKVVLTGYTEKAAVKIRGGWTTFWEGVKKFFYSFTADYSGGKVDDKTIEVWVARPRQYVSVMQQLIDTGEFTKRTGYKVKFSILIDEGKLILSNAANISPNAVMGISNFLPYEMGIRGLTYDITQFPDYGEIISRFSEGALIPLIADRKGLGLPETQDFYVMFYRKDILSRYGIPLPDTWQDVIEILPELQRYGLNFYIPLSSSGAAKPIMTTAPFIQQYGGNLFSDDGRTTTVDDENSLKAIKLMTEFYTLYGLPQQVNNFFDSFRNGSLPIGISTFSTYVMLSRAAPEIMGNWDLAVSPGVKDEKTGVVSRWQAGSSTSMVMMNKGGKAKTDATWELLKWWSSEQMQTEFANRLKMQYGSSYIYNSANLAAFNNSTSFSASQKRVINEQWQWLRETPKVPGWYMLERELSNSWNSIVIRAQNTRSVIEGAVSRTNKEMERKMTEFGYVKNGKPVKPYVVTTLEEVRKWKNKQ